MTDNTLLPTTVRFGSSDHRKELSAAMRLAEATVARVPASALGQPTPCASLDVGQLIGHLLFVGHRLEALYLDKGDAGLDPWVPVVGEPAAAAREMAAFDAKVEALLDTEGMLDRTINPWRPMTVRESLPCYVSEYTVHTWDLAVAAGLDVDWDPALVELSREAMECEVPAELRSVIFADLPEGIEAPFANAVPAAADASPIEQLAAYVGRVVPG